MVKYFISCSSDICTWVQKAIGDFEHNKIYFLLSTLNIMYFVLKKVLSILINMVAHDLVNTDTTFLLRYIIVWQYLVSLKNIITEILLSAKWSSPKRTLTGFHHLLHENIPICPKYSSSQSILGQGATQSILQAWLQQTERCVRKTMRNRMMKTFSYLK